MKKILEKLGKFVCPETMQELSNLWFLVTCCRSCDAMFSCTWCGNTSCVLQSDCVSETTQGRTHVFRHPAGRAHTSDWFLNRFIMVFL